MYVVSKSYHFAAAHTLRSPRLSDAENKRVYGRCANPTGHGHDYNLEFRLGSDRLTDGVVIGRGRLDELVDRHIVPRFDRKDLNSTLGPEVITSGENLAIAAHRLIALHLPAHLRLEVRLTETNKNSFVYRGE